MWALAHNKISRTILPLSTKASEVGNYFKSNKITNRDSDGHSTRRLYKDTDPGIALGCCVSGIGIRGSKSRDNYASS